MKLIEIVKTLGLSCIAGCGGAGSLETEVTGVVVGDVLSNIMHRARHGEVWVTVQCNPNVVAVAVLKRLAGVIVAAGAELNEAALRAAEREGVPVFAAGASVFETVGRLWAEINGHAPALKVAACDLHIHTCLSPCAADDMEPEKIVETALERDLDVIAVCDHNSAENAAAAVLAAAGTSLLAIPGIEVATAEETHIALLFPTAEQALKMQDTVYEHMGEGRNVPEKYGTQRVVDSHGRTVRIAEYMLIGRTDLRTVDAISRARELGGIAIAAHVDRPIFSVATKFGGIPDEMKFDAVEVSPNANIESARGFFPDFPVVTSSDAHTLDEIGRVRTKLEIRGLDFRGVREALIGRRFVI